MGTDFFKGKTAVITGAGGTLCSAIAVDLARRGCRTVLIGRTEEKLRTVADRIRADGGRAIAAPCDVLHEEELEETALRVDREFGPCSILVNGAGGNHIRAMTRNPVYTPEDVAREKPENHYGFFDLDMKAFQSVLEINTIGTVNASRVFGRRMAENGGGAILNFASMNSFRPLSRVPAYAMSKCAVTGFTQWLAEYLAPAGIRVNAVAPGFFINERSRNYLCTPDGGLSERGQNVMRHTPQKRFGEVEDLLGCVEWLLNDDLSSFVTGITVPVDGGFLSSSGI